MLTSTRGRMFRELCQHIAQTVTNYWPEAKFAALGAFIFLRFISPAVVAPNTVDVEIPKDNFETVKKGLMLVAKIIQNLANNIFFGKEAHMASLNVFLEQNIMNVTQFLANLGVSNCGLGLTRITAYRLSETVSARSRGRGRMGRDFI